MPVQLRPARMQDASSLAVLSAEVWTGTYLAQGINGFFADYVLDTFTQARFEAALSDPDEHLVVSQNAQGIDGFMRLRRGAPAPVAGGYDTELATLYVQPRHHGRGLGRALLRAACETAAAHGAQGLWLATNAQNTPAIGFYLAQGFAQIGETHFKLGDQAYLNNVYARAL